MAEQTQSLDKLLAGSISLYLKRKLSSSLKDGGWEEKTDFLPPFPQELLSKFKPFRTTYEIHTVHVDKS